MDKQLVGGIAWTAAAKWSSQILTWLCLLIVARLLTPSDFGIVGVDGVYLGLVAVFSEFGFGSAVITLRDLTIDEIAQINTFSAISGAIGFIVSCALAMPIGWFFRTPALQAVIVVMSTSFLITGFRTVPSSLLQRDFRFKRLSLIDTVAAVTQSLCVLLLAWWGAAYWSLALGSVVAALVSTTLYVASRPSGFARPRRKSITHALNFSWQVLVARLSWSLYSDADFLVAGRVLGATALGAYTFGWNLATLPVEKVTGLVGQVTPGLLFRKSIGPRWAAALSADVHRRRSAGHFPRDYWTWAARAGLRGSRAWRTLVWRYRTAGGVGVLRFCPLRECTTWTTIDGDARDTVPHVDQRHGCSSHADCVLFW